MKKSTSNSWPLNGFINKELYAPFCIDKDNDYYDTLKSKYKLLYSYAEDAGAGDEYLNIISKYTEKILQAIRNYYKGKISTSYKQIKNLLQDNKDNKLFFTTLINSDAFKGEKDKELQLFRGRLSKSAKAYSYKEMLPISFESRSITQSNRFSIPGLPCYYLGNSSYDCWIELGNPADFQFNVSPVLLDGQQIILNLAVMSRDVSSLHDFPQEKVESWLKQLIFMIATSFVVKEANRTFKSEYIVSQAIMSACNEMGIDGVAYYSKRVSDEIFGRVAINLALFAPSSKKKPAKIVEHLKINDSFNYGFFKNLDASNYDRDYELRSVRTGAISNIGTYKRQFSYRETEFYKFDQFLFSTWDDKDAIEWGHALTNE